MRFAIVFSLLGCLVACKDAAKSSSPSPAASAKPALKRMANGQCPPLGSTCAAGEYERYSACVDGKCDEANRACFGAEYKTAPGGPCADQMKCTAACACDDAACMQKCVPNAECRACMSNKLIACLQNAGCDVPACAAP